MLQSMRLGGTARKGISRVLGCTRGVATSVPDTPKPSPPNPAERLSNLVPLPRSATTSTRNFSPLNKTPDTTFPHNIRTSLTIRTLMAANLHLGHARESWNEHMLPYIYGERQGIHIINLEHTLVMLRRAINVTREIALRGGNIVFIGTRPSIHRITVEAAKRADGYFVTSWIGGTITNKERVLRRSVGYDPDKVAQILMPDGEESKAKEQRKPRNPQPYVHTPDLLIVLDYPNNTWAVREANQANIPVIAICDTDCNPRNVQYPIPANDDALTGVELIAGALSLASREGRDMRKKEITQQAKKFRA
ncbi:ribosomal protein S2 [Spizellomyces punctatus DAOM BR117]|uniref:Ribosomal protein S2 n=1 Tax=Spizellomyces punctatus (strain DAOM BR117) TaxID=645134 RepID=A0A0L0HW52_SPIPD|nr:ribosomal protein S2 [Spizellomyces punctatus DAOM BR117]KND05099.1 ribosomal protein S2 [Spizellomyces punctatus DAOM BR117]|eukprot:XP_016613138.1 ribosomal protein S2 [Spizellomyces punctatus DAOM BR117]